MRWLSLDLVSMDDVDYTGGLTLTATLQTLRGQGLTIAPTRTEDVQEKLERLGILTMIGAGRVFDSVSAAVDAYLQERGTGKPGTISPGKPPSR